MILPHFLKNCMKLKEFGPIHGAPLIPIPIDLTEKNRKRNRVIIRRCEWSLRDQSVLSHLHNVSLFLSLSLNKNKPYFLSLLILRSSCFYFDPFTLTF